jgi:hypothetical protein
MAETLVVIVDADNVRGHTRGARALDVFCTAVWRWWSANASQDRGHVLLCIDGGSRSSSCAVADGFAVRFSGPESDADTEIVHAVDEALARLPAVQLRVVTNDRQLQNRCQRHVPDDAQDADDEWYRSRGLARPGLRYEREWTKGARRPATHLDRMQFVTSQAFAAEVEVASASACACAPPPPSWWLRRWVLRVWMLWRGALVWLLGDAHGLLVPSLAADSPFAMRAAATARRVAHEGTRTRARHRSGQAPPRWRQLEAGELIVRPCRQSGVSTSARPPQF